MTLLAVIPGEAGQGFGFWRPRTSQVDSHMDTQSDAEWFETQSLRSAELSDVWSEGESLRKRNGDTITDYRK